jgi:hypothetical protein
VLSYLQQRGWNLEVQVRARPHRYRGLAFD